MTRRYTNPRLPYLTLSAEELKHTEMKMIRCKYATLPDEK